MPDLFRRMIRHVVGAANRLAYRLFLRRFRVFLIDRRIARSKAAHYVARRTVIAREFAAAGPGFVLIAGDSHAEMLGKPDLGTGIVNAGLGGIRTHEYAAYLGTLADPPAGPHRAAVAILFLGANDTIAVHELLSRAGRQSFETAARQAMRRLQDLATTVIVAEIPPVRPAAARFMCLEAVTAYSAVLRRLADEEGCLYRDPFESLRAAGAIVRDEVAMDALGIHLADYGLLAQALAPMLAPHIR